MTRDEHLKYCTICTKRKFNPKKGLVCSLTGEWANFYSTCENFDQDYAVSDKNNKLHDQKVLENETFGLSQYGIKNGIVAGIVIIVAALSWLITGMNLGWIFFYPFIMLIIGIFILINGLIKQSKKRSKKKNHDNILDEELI